MTPEALRTYLITRRVDEDVVQDILVGYLAAPAGSIRYPKAWAWKAAQHRAMDLDRQRNRYEPLTVPPAAHEPDPLRVAVGKQELTRAFRRGPHKRRLVRYKQSREDYRVLKRHKPL